MLNRSINFIFGLCSLIALVITIVIYNKTLIHIENFKDKIEFYSQLSEIISVSFWVIIALIIIFIIICALFFKTESSLIHQLGTLPKENELINAERNHYVLIIKNVSNCFHNIFHYGRDIITVFDWLCDKIVSDDITKDITEEECKQTLDKFSSFLLTLLSNIVTIFNAITRDNCSATIKIVNNGKVKTFFRDPISHRHRKKSDINQDGTRFIYKASDNYAFNIITDPNFKQTYFVCDDLVNFDDYYNLNQDWKKYYNATIVVPIQSRITPGTRPNNYHIIGFLCIDNIRGGFELNEVRDILSCIGDFLYVIFNKFNLIANISKNLEVSNDQVRDFQDWNDR